MAEEKSCKTHECGCVKKFFVVALGTFVGMFFALCSFASLSHTPQFSKQFAFQTVSGAKGVNQKADAKKVKANKPTKPATPKKEAADKKVEK